jgi:hypothetical protein
MQPFDAVSMKEVECDGQGLGIAGLESGFGKGQAIAFVGGGLGLKLLVEDLLEGPILVLFKIVKSVHVFFACVFD